MHPAGPGRLFALVPLALAVVLVMVHALPPRCRSFVVVIFSAVPHTTDTGADPPAWLACRPGARPTARRPPGGARPPGRGKGEAPAAMERGAALDPAVNPNPTYPTAPPTTNSSKKGRERVVGNPGRPESWG
ncbi:hypothetical protein GCM10009639_61960 [Kitasatospora putterlickiae]|uniref:Secreted protein n=1 Tax=Kitasatospora putterlickiae TaxID=221725 RepID=A0ABN1YFT4_9ACTN